MKIQAPCRLGERFNCELPTRKGRFTLTGMDFFLWASLGWPCTTIHGKQNPDSEQEHCHFFKPADLVEGVRIEIELPDEIIVPGYPLRKLGLSTDAVGRLSGLNLTEDGWGYYIAYGKHYGSPLELVRTPELDELFDAVLPLHAVSVNRNDFLL